MRGLLGALLWLALACAAPASAASVGASALVKVPAVDLLSVSDGGTIVLDNAAADPQAGDDLGPVADSTARLNYTHNSPTAKKLTAQVTANPGGSDITLTVSVAGGTGEKTLVDAGATAAVQDVYTNIPAGALSDLSVTYKASATAHGTPVSGPTSFVFTITFTSVSS
ncbi:MAG: hypothetical protein KGO96_09300 [Elusimicrobia bacterium]|nr:hypothetical protein [Elusimicrobiota bacterium]MDE2236697.1 hypothetical protein [Elusimicrobiota bacterium]MDE2426085.1 hypothetical protein [Elusimicrobiota bacterium]